MLLPKLNHNLILVHCLSGCDFDCNYGSRVLGFDRILHFHGLEGAKALAFCHFITGLNQYLHDYARQRSPYLQQEDRLYRQVMMIRHLPFLYVWSEPEEV